MGSWADNLGPLPLVPLIFSLSPNAVRHLPEEISRTFILGFQPPLQWVSIAYIVYKRALRWDCVLMHKPVRSSSFEGTLFWARQCTQHSEEEAGGLSGIDLHLIRLKAWAKSMCHGTLQHTRRNELHSDISHQDLQLPSPTALVWMGSVLPGLGSDLSWPLMKILEISLLVQSVLGQNAEVLLPSDWCLGWLKGYQVALQSLHQPKATKALFSLSWVLAILFCIVCMNGWQRWVWCSGCWASSSPAPPSFIETGFLSEAISSRPAGQGALWDPPISAQHCSDCSPSSQ